MFIPESACRWIWSGIPVRRPWGSKDIFLSCGQGGQYVACNESRDCHGIRSNGRRVHHDMNNTKYNPFDNVPSCCSDRKSAWTPRKRCDSKLHTWLARVHSSHAKRCLAQITSSARSSGKLKQIEIGCELDSSLRRWWWSQRNAAGCVSCFEASMQSVPNRRP
jgi:hypothetical protein